MKIKEQTFKTRTQKLKPKSSKPRIKFGNCPIRYFYLYIYNIYILDIQYIFTRDCIYVRFQFFVYNFWPKCDPPQSEPIFPKIENSCKNFINTKSPHFFLHRNVCTTFLFTPKRVHHISFYTETKTPHFFLHRKECTTFLFTMRKQNTNKVVNLFKNTTFLFTLRKQNSNC